MIDFSHTWSWSGTDYAHPLSALFDASATTSVFYGYAGATGHIDVYVDRDHETQDPPPPGSVPVESNVELMLLPERVFLKKKLSTTGGYVRFTSLDPSKEHLVFALGIQKGDGSGEWYVAEMYDRLYPTPD